MSVDLIPDESKNINDNVTNIGTNGNNGNNTTGGNGGNNTGFLDLFCRFHRSIFRLLYQMYS